MSLKTTLSTSKRRFVMSSKFILPSLGSAFNKLNSGQRPFTASACWRSTCWLVDWVAWTVLYQRGSDGWLNKKHEKILELAPAFQHCTPGGVKLTTVELKLCIHFRSCPYILDLVFSKQCLEYCCPRVPLFDCVICVIYARSFYTTSQQHDLWQWCNGKAIEALAERCPATRWSCSCLFVFVRLPLLR